MKSWWMQVSGLDAQNFNKMLVLCAVVHLLP